MSHLITVAVAFPLLVQEIGIDSIIGSADLFWGSVNQNHMRDQNREGKLSFSCNAHCCRVAFTLLKLGLYLFYAPP